MKVLSYLELCKLLHKIENGDTVELDSLTGFADFIRIKGFTNNQAGGLDFYSQKFKPELITELFEGFKQDMYFDKSRLWQIKKKYRIDFSNGELEINYNTMNMPLWRKKLTSIFPRTLDDFINDCQRAGIELKWKEKQ
jgi:hypothetical protein